MTTSLWNKRAASLTSEVDKVVVLQPADSLQLTTDVVLASGAEQVLDGRVGLIVAAEDLLRLKNPVRSSLSAHVPMISPACSPIPQLPGAIV